MATFNVYAAKTHLSRLIDEAAAGKEVILAKAGKPVARIVALGRARRRLGRLAGRVRIPDNFDAKLPADVQAVFEGRRR